GRYTWQKAQKQDRKVATFDFLGFTHYCDKTRYGKFKLGRKTAIKIKGLEVWGIKPHLNT
ncbi:MAG: hypothetical protein AB1595_00730, partial [bacterium]